MEILAKEYLNSLTEPKKESKEAEIKENSVRLAVNVPENSSTTQICCTSKTVIGSEMSPHYFQDVLTPTKRKLTAAEESQSTVTLMPRKKPRTDLPANDSPRKTNLRPLTPAETNPVRSSPRKTIQPPAAPARRETPRKSSAVGRQKEGVAKVKPEGGVGAVKQLHIGKNASKTKVLQTDPRSPCFC